MPFNSVKSQSYRSKEQGTLLKPNRQSYDFLFEKGILMITSKINNSDFLICFNFVLKYLAKILKIKDEDFYYFRSGYSTNNENATYKISYKIKPFEYLQKNNKDKLKISKTLSRNSIVFYGGKYTYSDGSYDLTHAGFIVSIFNEVWVISKFGNESLFLHKLDKVPEGYVKPREFLQITDQDYSNYLRRIELLIEKQITKMKKL